MPHVRSSRFWRVALNSSVTQRWVVSEISLFEDAACTRTIPVKQATGFLASSGSLALQQPAQCSFIFPNTSGCPNNTRLATYAELSMCKQTLCNSTEFPSYLSVQGENGYLLGALYQCRLGVGTSPLPSGAVCLPSASPVAAAFDGQTATTWSASAYNVSNTSKMAERLKTYVGLRLPAAYSVRCALIEQPDMGDLDTYTASSLIVQSSDDNVSWVDVLGGPANSGTTRINAIITPVASAMHAPLFSTTAVRGPVQPTALLAHKPLGAFADSSLTFTTPVAGNVTEMTLTVTPIMDLLPGENLYLILPGFQGASIALGDVALSATRMAPDANNVTGAAIMSPELSVSPQGGAHAWALGTSPPPNVKQGSFMASWDVNNTNLTITLGVPLFGGMSFRVTIASKNGISLPTSGITLSLCGTGDGVGPLSVLGLNGSSSSCGTCPSIIALSPQ